MKLKTVVINSFNPRGAIPRKLFPKTVEEFVKSFMMARRFANIIPNQNVVLIGNILPITRGHFRAFNAVTESVTMTFWAAQEVHIS